MIPNNYTVPQKTKDFLYLTKRILKKYDDVYIDVHEACFFKSNTVRCKKD